MKTVPLVILAFLLAASLAIAQPSHWASEGWRTDFSKFVVPLTDILDGGPRRDGIPPIDEPRFRPASEITDLTPQEPVIVFPIGPKARAYPLRVLTWHEIVNDTVDTLPVAVTYCPLCNTAIVFDRRLDERVLDFGTSGKLRHSDLIMYDRQTESWWQQFTGEAIIGWLAGRRLKLLPSKIVSFKEFKATAPNGPVLIPNDAAARRYGTNPYAGYDSRAEPYGLFQGELPKGMPAMARVVFARGAAGPVAVAMSHLAAKRRLIHEGFTFVWEAGSSSALDKAQIAAGRDVGSVTVTGPAGEPAVHDVTFAFALYAFHPDAVILTEAGLMHLADGRPAN